MTITLYGIKTCGSVKKAITLLDKHNIPFHFIDLKSTTPSQKQLNKEQLKQYARIKNTNIFKDF
nr:glutaredoxin domain-containing protein [uncultured Helicobacter sp.]